MTESITLMALLVLKHDWISKVVHKVVNVVVKLKVGAPLTLMTCSSVDLHSTDSVTSETAPSVPTVTTFTGTATVRPVRTAVLRISVSCKGKNQKTPISITLTTHSLAAPGRLYHQRCIHQLVSYQITMYCQLHINCTVGMLSGFFSDSSHYCCTDISLDRRIEHSQKI